MRLLRAPIADLADSGYRPHGVIHVGVNDGEELPWYFHMHYEPVLGFEPLPEVYEQTSMAFAAHQSAGRLWLVNVALGEWDQLASIRVPVRRADGMLATKGASLLPERYLSNEYAPGDMQPVSVRRFESWLQQTSLLYERTSMTAAGAAYGIMARYDTLVIDAQGMTLQILKGFGNWLHYMRYLQLELSESPIYEGEAAAVDVLRYVAAFGFQPITPIVSHGDVFFVRP